MRFYGGQKEGDILIDYFEISETVCGEEKYYPKAIKVRKDHACEWCTEAIKKGENAIRIYTHDTGNHPARWIKQKG